MVTRKVRRAHEFVPVITSYEVLSEGKTEDGDMVEAVRKVVFTPDGPRPGGDTVKDVWGELLMTYSFEWRHPDVEEGSAKAAELEEAHMKGAKIAVEPSVLGQNHQVPLMGEIYWRATRTIIWLGAGLPRAAGPLSHVAVFGRLFHFRTVPGRSALSERERGWGDKLLGQAEKGRIEHICASKLFQRTWTIQEFFLAEIAVFMVGDAALLYTYFTMRLVENILPTVIQPAAMNAATYERDEVHGVLSHLGAVWEDVVTPEVDYSKILPELYEELASGMTMSAITLWPPEIASGGNRRSSHLPSWVMGLRDLEGIHKTEEWPSRTRRAVHSETRLNAPESPASPGKLPVMCRRLAAIYLVYSRMPPLRALSDEHAGDVKRTHTDWLSDWTAKAAYIDARLAGKGVSRDEDNLAALQNLTLYHDYIRERHEPRRDRQAEGDKEPALMVRLDSSTTDKVYQLAGTIFHLPISQ
ncbi:hypothetical protein DL771_003393 [Monosporascus sp. 5C6A]|nr:hypothetical protein DL771_003393 [Monosporascus sp. 5C6A]